MIRNFRWIIISFAMAWLVSSSVPTLAESPAPTIHWGGMGYPDQFPLLNAGLTINRFTEFDNPSRMSAPYDSTIKESFGLNQITISWTQFLARFEGWSSNLTLGVGPTSEQPSKFLQNSVIHKAFGIPPVSTLKTRNDTDAMVDGSLTKWLTILDQRRVFFIGGGFSIGTLYQEGFIRAGVRRADLLTLVGADNWPLRFSMMGRYSRLGNGALLHQVAPQSWLWQPSISIGPYQRQGPAQPPWELEFSYTWDSGIFVNGVGESHKEQFASIAFRYRAVRVETWNDMVNKTDRGPTYGASLTIDLLCTLTCSPAGARF